MIDVNVVPSTYTEPFSPLYLGHLSEELSALLTGDEKLSVHGGTKGAEYNLPKSVIKVNLRKGVPARKKR